MNPTDDPWRLAVKLKSRQALIQYMDFAGCNSVRKLETKCAAVKSKGPKPKRGILGHLISGERDTCTVRTAQVVEEALGCPPGFLFAPSMSRVVDTRRQKVAA